MNLELFFNPKSVAIVGASHTPGKIGYAILDDLLKGNFKGNVYPVNPDTTPILNKAVYPSVKAIPSEIDLAIIAVPAVAVPKVLEECVRKKINGVIIISGGFSEIGEEGKKLEEKCKKIIKGKKTRVIGPNCIGIFDPSTDLDTLFLTEERMGRPKKGSIAFISQSGAVGSTILDWLSGEHIGISKFISYGNAMDINEADLLEYLANDITTNVIAVYLEGIKSDGRSFIETLKKTVRKKPVVVLKAGKTEKGSKAAVSHTASLAGDAIIYSAVFNQFGAIEASDWTELFDFCKAFSMQPLPKGNNLLIVTDGGGFGVLATDEAERQGIKLEEPSKTIKKVLSKNLPSYVSLHNPIDLTGDVTAERYNVVMENCIKQYDGIIAIVLFQVPLLEETIVDRLVEMKKYGKPILCCASGGTFTEKLSDRLEANGIPVYPTPERAVKSFSAMIKYSRVV
ncbi:MAG: CoA-binding protein [Candidatus Aenigmarchaeota archaeon]|nr:CoA-binding protein [Candidatus Aenigmarchaeota archaeon]